MANSYFQFKQFTIHQDHCAMKVTTDACLFGAWAAEEVQRQLPDVKRVLDIGTGTGLLSLMLAQKTNVPVDAVEIDPDAFEQAKENISASPWRDKVTVYEADAAQFEFASKYDIIISNPPFYENELKSGDAKKNLAHHEGLSLQQLLKLITENLSPGGSFFLLLPYKRDEEAEKMINAGGLSIIQKIFVRQSVRHDSFRIMIKGGHGGDNKKSTTEISIWDEQHQYTPEFLALLRDYYLYL
ncbi:MAG TPA: methyltransferase [Chitinophagaceae bacterium]|nr:methyltransferase [Chitinophagaceae bacterium]